MKYHLSQNQDDGEPVCSGTLKGAWSVRKDTWDTLPLESRCKRCLGKMERARFGGWLDAQKPRFSTQWERNDYERENRGEAPLGPSTQ